MTKILKFGGTSVGSAVNMRRVADIIVEESSTITVLSAMSGTTDTLVRICCSAKRGESIYKDMVFLKGKYSETIRELLTDKLSEATVKSIEVFELIESCAKNFTPQSEGIILAQGEKLTSAIFALYLEERGKPVVLIDITESMHTKEDGKVDTDRLKKHFSDYLAKAEKGTYFITQGFICTNHLLQCDNLGRGGSDYSAALIGAAISAELVQIWTDIDGMHNNDPRYVEGTEPIRTMSFDLAAELAYFGAKILHPSTIQPCKEHEIAVQLRNTMNPKAEGTLITNTESNNSIYRAVAAKDNITIVRITSTRMLMAYGFLRKVFEVFERHRTPIDMITTSEVAVSLTIDDDTKIEQLTKDLEQFGRVEVEQNNTIICVVGNIDYNDRGIISHILYGVIDTPIKMLSYGASYRSVSFLIDSCNKIATLRDIHNQLFR